MMRNSTTPTHTLSFPEQLECFEFCNSDFASNLVALASHKKIILGLINLPVNIICQHNMCVGTSLHTTPLYMK